MKKYLNILIFLLFVAQILNAQDLSLKFRSIGLDQGLSQGTIHCIIQDEKGFVWIGTEDGLNRYDGYSFKVFRHQHNGKPGLSNSSIMSLLQDSEGIIWVGTELGLNKLNPKTNKIKTFIAKKDNKKTLSGNIITAIYEDSKNRLWIGTKRNGLNLYNKTKQAFIKFNYSPARDSCISCNSITSIIEDDLGNLWIGTENGLNLYNEQDSTFKQFKRQPNDPKSLSHNKISDLFKGNNGKLWIATYGGGLNCFDYNTKKFNAYKAKPGKKGSLPDNYINVVIQDSQGTLWIGTENAGLCKKAPSRDVFQCYQHNNSIQNSLNGNRVTALMEDQTGVLWIGTYSINTLNLTRQNFHSVKPAPNDPQSLTYGLVRSFFKEENNLWIGTDGDGINRFDSLGNLRYHYRDNGLNGTLKGNIVYTIKKGQHGDIYIGTDEGLNKYIRKTNSFIHYRHIPGDPNSLSGNTVRCIFPSSKNILWLGTLSGLNKFDIKNRKFTSYTHEPGDSNSLSNNKVFFIVGGDSNNLWINTHGGGLNKFDTVRETFTHYQFVPNKKGLCDNYLISLYKDTRGDIWIGTQEGGLNRFDPITLDFSCITIENGLPNNCIYSIMEDDKNNLWLSHNRGITKYSIDDNEFRNYTTEDGLQSNEFYGNAHFKDKDGRMYFGGVNGYNAFYPDSIHDNPFPPEVVITSFRIFNQEVNPGRVFHGKNILEKTIPYTNEITISHKEEVISFEFAALHFASPEKNEFAYKLEGFDKNWNYSGNRRHASYTNLPHGEYTFKVKASNSDGVWNEKGASIELTVLPPFWKTWPFRIAVIILIALLMLIYNRLRLRMVKKQKQKLEKLVQERTSELQKVNVQLEENQAELHQRQEEIVAQSEALQKQNREIREKHDEIIAQRDEIQKANEELQKLSIVASETDNGVIITDKKGNIEWINEAFTRLFGHNLEEFKSNFGSNICEASSNRNIKELFNYCITTKKSVIYEAQNITKGGKRLWVQTTLTPVLDRDGNVFKLVAIDSDISKLKNAEEEIRQRNEEIMSQKDLLEKQNFEMSKQRDEIEQKNKILEKHKLLITDSIHYAQTIQKLILPVKENLDKVFESFVIHLPKDIVSGDFYWWSELQLDDEYIVAVVDCTGHGVPGAFMSMLGNDLLNNIIKHDGIRQPEKVVNELDDGVVNTLKQEVSDNMDGMDLILCRVKKRWEKREVTFVGANRPLVYYSQKEKKLMIKKGWEKTVGGILKLQKDYTFKSKTYMLDEGDILYLFSDGFTSQLDVYEKRYGSKRLFNLLEEIAEFDFEKQKQILEKDITEFMRGTTQYDDITFWGIRI